MSDHTPLSTPGRPLDSSDHSSMGTSEIGSVTSASSASFSTLGKCKSGRSRGQGKARNGRRGTFQKKSVSKTNVAGLIAQSEALRLGVATEVSQSFAAMYQEHPMPFQDPYYHPQPHQIPTFDGCMHPFQNGSHGEGDIMHGNDDNNNGIHGIDPQQLYFDSNTNQYYYCCYDPMGTAHYMFYNQEI